MTDDPQPPRGRPSGETVWPLLSGATFGCAKLPQPDMRRFLWLMTLFLVMRSACAAHHVSAASAGVSFYGSHAVGNSGAVALSAAAPRNVRTRRMYAMCPPHFQRVGSECYALVDDPYSWLEAHFYCKDKNSKLAEPQKLSDRKLRAFLQQHDDKMARAASRDAIWIGATYDWQNLVWQWSISGKNLSYDAFSQMDPQSIAMLENHCAVYDPDLKYRWSARNCPDKHRFICQHKMPKVSERNRFKVYGRWNQTYPHQLANEVLLEVIERSPKRGARTNRRVKAEDSKKEILMPANRQRRTRPRKPLPVAGGSTHQPPPNTHPNDIDYPQPVAPARQHPRPRRPRPRPTNASATPSSLNEILPAAGVTAAADAASATEIRRRTQYDRKLERQRQNERLRQQRKQERQERLRQEKRLREEQQQQQSRPQKDPATQNPQALSRGDPLQDQNQETWNRAQRQRELVALKQQQAEEERRSSQDEEDERLRKERFERQRNQDREERELAARRLQQELEAENKRREQERLTEERLQREEYEKRWQQARTEQEQKLFEERERKRLQDEANRKQQELEERQRQELIKRQQEDEEKQLELKRLEEAKRLEEQELSRFKEEKRKREELQRKRDEEIRRREDELWVQEEEERRLQQELRESEEARKRSHEAAIKREEEEAKQREEAAKREAEELERQRLQRLKDLKREEDQRVRESLEHRRRHYAERIARLSPEDQKKFFEMRKRRKELKMKPSPEVGPKGERSVNEAFIPDE